MKTANKILLEMIDFLKEDQQMSDSEAAETFGSFSIEELDKYAMMVKDSFFNYVERMAGDELEGLEDAFRAKYWDEDIDDFDTDYNESKEDVKRKAKTELKIAYVLAKGLGSAWKNMRGGMKGALRDATSNEERAAIEKAYGTFAKIEDMLFDTANDLQKGLEAVNKEYGVAPKKDEVPSS